MVDEMNEFAVDLEGFKQAAKKFIDRLRKGGIDGEQTDGMRRVMALHFLHFQGNDLDRYQAKIVLDLAFRELYDYLADLVNQKRAGNGISAGPYQMEDDL